MQSRVNLPMQQRTSKNKKEKRKREPKDKSLLMPYLQSMDLVIIVITFLNIKYDQTLAFTCLILLSVGKGSSFLSSFSFAEQK